MGLLGPNGAGKTTTFSMVAGFLSPSSGKLTLDAEDITKLPAYQRARKRVSLSASRTFGLQEINGGG